MRRFTIALFVLAISVNSFAGEVVTEIRIHGNHRTADAEILALAGIVVGTPVDGATAEALEAKLREDGRFESVEIRKRYRSMTRLDEVVLIISVVEKQPIKDKFLLAPVLDYSDEYGFAVGGGASTLDLLGFGERLGLRLSLGHVKEARFEVDGRVDRQWIDRLLLAVGISERENPHFEIDDQRFAVSGEIGKRFGAFRVGLNAAWEQIEYAELSEDQTVTGITLAYDTREERTYPRNAVFAEVEVEQLNVLDDGPSANRFNLDLRGYKSVVGSMVLAVNARFSLADESLRDYEKPFLGGAATLRGHRPGRFVGDDLAVGSLELRIPMTSPLSFGRTGFHLFYDTGAVYDHGESLSDARFQHGVGVGAFLNAAIINARIDLGWDLEDSVRLHFTSGVRF